MSLQMDFSSWGHHRYRTSCLMACLEYCLRAVPKAKDPVIDGLPQRTNRLWLFRTHTLNLMGDVGLFLRS